MTTVPVESAVESVADVISSTAGDAGVDGAGVGAGAGAGVAIITDTTGVVIVGAVVITGSSLQSATAIALLVLVLIASEAPFIVVERDSEALLSAT
jgi:hypothetical protein